MATRLARLPTHQMRERDMRHVPEQKRDLVWATLPGVMAGLIAQAPNLAVRRSMLESVPELHRGMDLRARTEVLARYAYRKRRRG